MIWLVQFLLESALGRIRFTGLLITIRVILAIEDLLFWRGFSAGLPINLVIRPAAIATIPVAQFTTPDIVETAVFGDVRSTGRCLEVLLTRSELCL
jgi:hypothetical protein